MKNGASSILTLYAISQVHAGSGSAVSTVDLPIQRERHTNYPCIYASSLKGAMRAYFREFGQDRTCNEQTTKLINFIFGSDEQDGWTNKEESIPGAISISDAKLLAFPVRSNITPFVYVTCPNIINRIARDLEFLGINAGNIDTLKVAENKAKILVSDTKSVANGSRVILEDAVVEVENGADINFIRQNF